MSKIAIIVGHSRQGTFAEALGEAYQRGAQSAGHDTTLIVVSRLAFDPILKGAYVEIQPREPDLEWAFQAIRAADHLVIVFPLWLGDMPAILKGFFERILQPDIFEPAREGRFVQVFAGKSARLIVTMGMPGFVYRWWFGPHAVRILKQNILGFMGVSPIRTTVHGSVESAGAERRRTWLSEAEDMGRKAS